MFDHPVVVAVRLFTFTLKSSMLSATTFRLFALQTVCFASQLRQKNIFTSSFHSMQRSLSSMQWSGMGIFFICVHGRFILGPQSHFLTALHGLSLRAVKVFARPVLLIGPANLEATKSGTFVTLLFSSF